MIDTYSAGGIVINDLKQVVVVKQDNGTWSFPKGHLELGETTLEAAKREVCEESEVTDLELIKELGTYQRAKNNDDSTGIRKNITLFLFKTNQKELKPVDPENPEARWVDKDKVADLLSYAKDREFFLKILPLFK
jgi:ADP-ribose pyrophosphatase YjhB (NUDIX family)